MSKELTPTKDVGTTVDKTTIPVHDEQSNQIARHHPYTVILFPSNDYEGPQEKNLNRVLTKEATATKDVGTTVDKTMILV